MLKHKDHFHGSDLETIERLYGIPKERITSFSANVNPLGISEKMANELSSHIRCIESYPDREYTALKEAIAAYVKADPENILTGNGTSELISRVTKALHPKKALILGPTYSEYERAISSAGGSSVYLPLREEDDFLLHAPSLYEKLSQKIDLLTICNPNNPTGTLIGRSEMRQILNHCMEHGIFVMTDETYMEFAENPEESSSVPLTSDYNNLIVLRGVSKFFASPGLRLGYAVTGNHELLRCLLSSSDPWTVSSFAELAGRVMFSDSDYIRRTRELIAGERARMYALFSASSRYKAFRPAANFMLLKILEDGLTSQSLFEKCIREGLMIRDCSTFPFLSEKFIRFCFLLPEQNDALADLLL